MFTRRNQARFAITLAFLAGLFPPAVRAADKWITVSRYSYAAIAYSPTTGAYRYAYNYGSRQAAENAALKAMNDKDARIVCWVNQGFCVLALGDDKSTWGVGWKHGHGANFLDAQMTALEECRKRTTGARIMIGISSDGQIIHEPFKYSAAPQTAPSTAPSVPAAFPADWPSAPVSPPQPTASPFSRFQVGDKVEVLVEEPSGTPTEIGTGTQYIGEVVSYDGGIYVDVKIIRNGQEETKSFMAAFVGKVAPGGHADSAAAAAPAEPGVPQARIGDKLEQFTARFGEPKTNAPYYVFRDSDWTITATFSRGRAYQVNYSKQLGKDVDFENNDLRYLASPPETDYAALLKLNGADRAWEGPSTKLTTFEQVMGDKRTVWLLPSAEAHTKGPLLYCHYKVSVSGGAVTKMISVGTLGQKLLRDGSIDRTKMNRDDAKAAWDMGLSLGALAAPFLQDEELTEANRLLRKARDHFTFMYAAEAARSAGLSANLPDLPVKTGDFEQDFPAIIKYMGAASDFALKAIGEDDLSQDELAKGETGVAACFELALGAPTMIFLSQGGAPRAKADFLEHLAAAGRNSNLPKELWEPLIYKARAGAPFDELFDAYAQMAKDVREWLAAKSAEWTPPRPLSEQ